MKNIKYYTVLLFILTGMNQLFISCNKETDYSAITYKNYLRFEINRSGTFLKTAVEGTNEGEYKTGSIAEYQVVIEEADLVCSDTASSQKEIDLSYSELLQAGENFYDKMAPFKTSFEALINYADFTVNYPDEGALEGNAKPGSKSILQNIIDNSKITLNRSDLTQRMIDSDRVILLNAIYSFDGNIIGKANLFVENFSFESPAFNTTNFAEVPGWRLFGKGENFGLKAEIYQGGTIFLPTESVPDGEFVAKIGSYSQGIYQSLNERIHPNVKYTLDFKASLLENNEDAYGKKYKVVILSRVIVFEKVPGDYRFTSVISQSYDTLGMAPGAFVNIKRDIDISASSEFLEKNMTVDFLVRHSFDATKPIWAECYVAVDDVKMYRKQN
jgi:hypothetical protein